RNRGSVAAGGHSGAAVRAELGVKTARSSGGQSRGAQLRRAQADLEDKSRRDSASAVSRISSLRGRGRQDLAANKKRHARRGRFACRCAVTVPNYCFGALSPAGGRPLLPRTPAPSPVGPPCILA